MYYVETSALNCSHSALIWIPAHSLLKMWPIFLLSFNPTFLSSILNTRFLYANPNYVSTVMLLSLYLSLVFLYIPRLVQANVSTAPKVELRNLSDVSVQLEV